MQESGCALAGGVGARPCLSARSVRKQGRRGGACEEGVASGESAAANAVEDASTALAEMASLAIHMLWHVDHALPGIKESSRISADRSSSGRASERPNGDTSRSTATLRGVGGQRNDQAASRWRACASIIRTPWVADLTMESALSRQLDTWRDTCCTRRDTCCTKYNLIVLSSTRTKVKLDPSRKFYHDVGGVRRCGEARARPKHAAHSVSTPSIIPEQLVAIRTLYTTPRPLPVLAPKACFSIRLRSISTLTQDAFGWRGYLDRPTRSATRR